jgi:hypothetical protein
LAGYANRVVTLHFPELAEEGDDIHVVLRNPRLMAADELRSAGGSGGKEDMARIAAAQAAVAAGGEVPDGLVTDEDANRGYALVAKLVIGWHVYDATSTEDDMPLLPLPATVESVGKLPMEILTAIMEQVGKAAPKPSPADGTSTTF